MMTASAARRGDERKTGKPRVRARSRRGGVFLLALFLVLSGALRLGDGMGRALAETASVEAPGRGDAASGTAGEETPHSALLEALRERESRVAEKERRAAEEERLLAAARTEIDGKLAELRDAEANLAETIAQADKAAEKDVVRLVSVYETMKPKDAARLFGEMEPDFAAGFLARMRPEAAASVLAGLEPSKAYAISAVLAGRNALAPKS